MKKLLLLFSIILIIFMFYYLGFGKHLSIENIKKSELFTNTIILRQEIENNYFESVARFMGVYILLTAFGLPFAVFLTIIGGFLFGTLAGALYSCVSAAIGASLAFLIFRYLLGDWIKHRCSSDRLVNFRQEIKKYGYSYLLSIHLSAVIPLFMINVFASLAEVKIWTFFWTTLVGTFLPFLIYAFAGKQFHNINSISDVFTLKVLLALLGLAVLVSLPVILRKFKKNRSSVL